MLQLIHDFQSTIQYSIQIKLLKNVANVMLTQEKQFPIDQQQFIIPEFCQTLWNKIVQTALHKSTTKHALENICFIQMMVEHRLQFSNSFVTNVLNTILSTSFDKTNESIQLLISIFQNASTDQLTTDLRLKILEWLNTTNIKEMSTGKPIKIELKAELMVLCVFSKIEKNAIRNVISNGTDDSMIKYRSSLNTLRTELQYKSLNQLIVIVSSNSTNCMPSFYIQTSHQLPNSSELKSVINEDYFKKLYELIIPENEPELTDNHFQNVMNITNSLHLILQLLNKLMFYNALDQDKFMKTFLAKKVHLKLEQIDMVFARIDRGVFESNDIVRVLEQLALIFNSQYHSVLQQLIKERSVFDVIGWLANIENDHQESCNSKLLELIAEENLKDVNHKIRYKAGIILAFFCSGPNAANAFQAISECKFNMKNNEDLFIVHQMIKVQLL